MESQDVRLARIEENVIHTKEAVARIEASLPALGKATNDNTLDIAILKRDAKWRSSIIIGIGGVLGTLGGIAVEWIRHG